MVEVNKIYTFQTPRVNGIYVTPEGDRSWKLTNHYSKTQRSNTEKGKKGDKKQIDPVFKNGYNELKFSMTFSVFTAKDSDAMIKSLQTKQDIKGVDLNKGPWKGKLLKYELVDNLKDHPYHTTFKIEVQITGIEPTKSPALSYELKKETKLVEQKVSEDVTKLANDMKKKKISVERLKGSLHNISKFKKPSEYLRMYKNKFIIFKNDLVTNLSKGLNEIINVRDEVESLIRDVGADRDRFNIIASKIESIYRTPQKLADTLITSVNNITSTGEDIKDRARRLTVKDRSERAKSKYYPKLYNKKIDKTSYNKLGSYSKKKADTLLLTTNLKNRVALLKNMKLLLNGDFKTKKDLYLVVNEIIDILEYFKMYEGFEEKGVSEVYDSLGDDIDRSISRILSIAQDNELGQLVMVNIKYPTPLYRILLERYEKGYDIDNVMGIVIANNNFDDLNNIEGDIILVKNEYYIG